MMRSSHTRRGAVDATFGEFEIRRELSLAFRSIREQLSEDDAGAPSRGNRHPSIGLDGGDADDEVDKEDPYAIILGASVQAAAAEFMHAEAEFKALQTVWQRMHSKSLMARATAEVERALDAKRSKRGQKGGKSGKADQMGEGVAEEAIANANLAMDVWEAEVVAKPYGDVAVTLDVQSADPRNLQPSKRIESDLLSKAIGGATSRISVTVDQLTHKLLRKGGYVETPSGLRFALARQWRRLHMRLPRPNELGVAYVFEIECAASISQEAAVWEAPSESAACGNASSQRRMTSSEDEFLTVGISVEGGRHRGQPPNLPWFDLTSLLEELDCKWSELERARRSLELVWHQLRTRAASDSHFSPFGLRQSEPDEATLWLAAPHDGAQLKFVKIHKARYEPNVFALLGQLCSGGGSQRGWRHEASTKIPSYIRSLTDAYDLRFWYFEAVEALRKIAILGLPTLFEPGTTQIAFGMLLTVFFSALYSHLGPYNSWQTRCRPDLHQPNPPPVCAQVLLRRCPPAHCPLDIYSPPGLSHPRSVPQCAATVQHGDHLLHAPLRLYRARGEQRTGPLQRHRRASRARGSHLR